MEENIKIQVINTVSDLNNIEGDWNELNAKIHSHYYHQFQYYVSYYKYLKPESTLPLIIVIFNKEELIGIFPWEIRCKQFFFYQYYEVGSPAHDHMDLCDILLLDKYLPLVAKNFKTIISHLPKNSIFLTQNHRDDFFISRLLALITNEKILKSITSRNCTVNTSGEKLSHYISVKEYKDIKRLMRKIQKSTSYQFKHITGKNISDEDYTDFLSVEASGWKGMQKSAIFFHDNINEFYKSMMLSDFIQMNFFIYNQQIIAAQYCFRDTNELSFPKIAIDENFKHLAPTIILCYQSFMQGLKSNPYLTMNFITAPKWAKKWQADFNPVYSFMIKINNFTRIIFNWRAVKEKIKHRLPRKNKQNH